MTETAHFLFLVTPWIVFSGSFFFSFETWTSFFHCFKNENKKLKAFGKTWNKFLKCSNLRNFWNDWLFLSLVWRVSEVLNVLLKTRLRDKRRLYLILRKVTDCAYAETWSKILSDGLSWIPRDIDSTRHVFFLLTANISNMAAMRINGMIVNKGKGKGIEVPCTITFTSSK